MADYRNVARIARWGLMDTIYQLDFIPEEKFAWSPAPGVKSVQAIVAEVVGVIRAVMPNFEAKDCPEFTGEFTAPESIAEAKAWLKEHGDAYLDALDAAVEADLQSEVAIPGGRMKAAGSVLYPAAELLHHHGQITFIQSLLGDQEVHLCFEALAAFN